MYEKKIDNNKPLEENYEMVIFDLDGTLFDTSEGIINSIDYAIEVLKLSKPTLKQKYSFIGPPVFESFKKVLNLNEEQTKEATTLYRKRYAEKGIFEAKLYDGIIDILKFLKGNNIKIGVATLKGEEFAIKMTQHFEIANYFDVIYGQNKTDSRTKADTIKLALKDLNIPAEKALMVGDSMHDYNGAKDAKNDFCAVTYGFGFNKETAKGKYIIHSPLELFKLNCFNG